MLIRLLFLRVFQGIQRHGKDNDRTLDDVLPVRIHTDVRQAVVDTVKISTPVTTPATEPTPPANDTPPTTQAAIASSSYIKPRLLVALPIRPASSKPPKA